MTPEQIEKLRQLASAIEHWQDEHYVEETGVRLSALEAAVAALSAPRVFASGIDLFNAADVVVHPNTTGISWDELTQPYKNLWNAAADLIRQPQPKTLDMDALAQEIRRVGGNHSLGAAALAEALMPFLQGAAPQPAPAQEYADGEALYKATLANTQNGVLAPTWERLCGFDQDIWHTAAKVRRIPLERPEPATEPLFLGGGKEFYNMARKSIGHPSRTWDELGPIPQRIWDNAAKGIQIAAKSEPLNAAPASPWLPIESAPRDGTEVLVLFYGTAACSARWTEHRQGGDWYSTIGKSILLEPTHWMPLPEPPPPPKAQKSLGQVLYEAFWVGDDEPKNEIPWSAQGAEQQVKWSRRAQAVLDHANAAK